MQMLPSHGLGGRYLAQPPPLNPTPPHAALTRTVDHFSALDSRSSTNMDSFAYPRAGAWLPSDLAASCGIRRESAASQPFMPSGPIDAWDTGHTAERVESLVNEAQSQLASLQVDASPDDTPSSPFPTLHANASQAWPAAPEIGVSRVKEKMADGPAPHVPPLRNGLLPPSEHTGSVSETITDAVAETTSPLSSCTLLIERLGKNIMNEDIEQHFTSPPEWPPSHPMRRVYSHVSEKTGAVLSARPEPFRIKSVRILRHGNATQAEVCFSSAQDCERALVEMQHTMLVPRQTPWKSARLLLSTTAATPPEPRSRPPRAQRSATTPAKRAGSRRRASDTTRTSSSDSTSTSRVPTTLNFLQNEDGETTSSAAPMLASALAVAHTSSALDPNNTTVFVGSLFNLASETTLYSLFSPFGPILSVNIPRGQDCGFVQFARKDDAARAIAEMQNCPVAGGALRLSWGRSIGEKAAARAATRAGLRWVEDVA